LVRLDGRSPLVTRNAARSTPTLSIKAVELPISRCQRRRRRVFLDIRPHFSYQITNLARRRALSRCDPEGGASAVPAGGFAIRSRAVWVTSPPALRPGCQVPGLSASDGVGNACILPFARSAAWTESWRSLAGTSAVAERRKASGPPPYTPPHAGEEGDKEARFRAADKFAQTAHACLRMRGQWMVRLSALRSLFSWRMI